MTPERGRSGWRTEQLQNEKVQLLACDELCETGGRSVDRRLYHRENYGCSGASQDRCLMIGGCIEVLRRFVGGLETSDVPHSVLASPRGVRGGNRKQRHSSGVWDKGFDEVELLWLRSLFALLPFVIIRGGTLAAGTPHEVGATDCDLLVRTHAPPTLQLMRLQALSITLVALKVSKRLRLGHQPEYVVWIRIKVRTIEIPWVPKA